VDGSGGGNVAVVVFALLICKKSSGVACNDVARLISFSWSNRSIQDRNYKFSYMFLFSMMLQD
jgi:hypothetical protein